MPKTKVEVYDKDQLIYPFIESDHVTFSNGMKVTEMLDQSISMPTVTHEDLSFKAGVGDQDVSSSIVDSSVSEMTIKGKTYQNILPEPSTHVLTNNKEMFKVNEGLDSNVEIMDGVSKSAILKGQTLVNLSENLQTITFTLDWWYKEEKLMDNIEKLKRNTCYTVLYRLENISGNHQNYDGIGLGIGMNAFHKDLPGITSILDKNGGWCKIKFQLTDELIEQNPTYKQLYIRPIRRGTNPVEGESVDYTIRGFAILEGDYITNPIPFNKVFEGMQSVKMPVLTTVGKNLLPYNEMFISPFTSATPYITKNVATFPFTLGVNGRGVGIKFKVEPNTTYTLSSNVVIPNTVVGVAFYKNESDTTNHGNKLGIAFSTNIEESIKTFTTPNECNWIVCGMYILYTYEQSGGTVVISEMPKLQLEKNTQATTYEPHKTNILSTPEDLELRGIGDIQDTLDCLMGEVTQAIYEYTFTGDEDWKISGGGSGGYTYFSFSASLLPIRHSYSSDTNIPIMCDRLPLITYRDLDDGLKSVGINLSYFFRLNFSDCDSNNGATVEDLKAYLKANPTTVQYPISKSVKTVDLSSSGNWEKIVLDGKQGITWQEGSVNAFYFRENRLKKLQNYSQAIISDTGSVVNNYKSFVDGCNEVQITGYPDTQNKYPNENWLYFRVPNIKSDVNALKQYLSQNPITVWFQTATHQDSTQVKQPIFFADGHIIQSSGADNSLIPTLDYQAKTSNSYVMDLIKAGTWTVKSDRCNGRMYIGSQDLFFNLNSTNRTITLTQAQIDSLPSKLWFFDDTFENGMILEGDLTSKTIPYFKGIKSAFEDEDKIEVLSTGKNLAKVGYDIGEVQDGYIKVINETTAQDIDYTHKRGVIEIKPNTTYTCSWVHLSGEATVKDSIVPCYAIYDKDMNVLKWASYTTTTPSNAKYIGRVRLHWSNGEAVFTNFKFVMQLEESPTATSYEPYKSNSTKIPLLSPLRSLPNGVCDELIVDRMKNKATLIQRVEAIPVTSVDDIRLQANLGKYNRFFIHKRQTTHPTFNMSSTGSQLSNWCPHHSGFTTDSYHFYVDGAGDIMLFDKSETLNSIRTKMSQSPFVALHQLATPIVTEIDLEGFPYIYKDGHIFLNSEIVPITENTYSINQCQQISASNEDIIRHEKELTYLQKLIAQYVQVDYESALLSLKV